MPVGGSQRYLTSTAVFMSEVLKLTVCLTASLYEISQTISPSLPATSLFSEVTNAAFTGDSWKLAIPASLYVLQNSLQYIAISNLDSATYQVTYEFKILPTAIFSIYFLQRSLSLRKWIALVLLMFGIGVLLIPSSDPHLTPFNISHPHWHIPRSLEDIRHISELAPRPIYKRSATYEGIAEDEGLLQPQMNGAVGFSAAIAGCTVSALASIYFEKILKDSIAPTSLWIRNVQLAFYSLFPSLFIGVMFVDGEEIAQHGFFVGYNWFVWLTIACKTTGGILVSLCIMYADNIAKSFAMSLSILVGLSASVWLFDFTVTLNSNHNLVVSAPTGGGKTAILEMAICRLVAGFQTDQYKVVYMAPTKSLCSERQRDWQAKFATLDLQCAELTGDTDNAHLRSVQSANIVITTPEKWDSMTRKWKDHAKLMRLVKLFLIDEVHILNDARGATLEAVVSRMKSVSSDVRFVALSATIPNSADIASWLVQDTSNELQPAICETFGEEFRPVKLQKHVVGLPYRGNDFGFEIACDPVLPGIIAKYSHKKPIMVFCITRKSTVSTARLLADLWAAGPARERYWKGPTQQIMVADLDLRTLGVNLPCHLVIIKNTVSYQDDRVKEYSDLEVMQMLGRAGRPQFDDSAVAVIITKQEKVRKYEKLVSGDDLLESCLHLHLIDHLNAEIGLGTISDLHTAKRWLASTFLYIRLGKNPDHYKIDGDAKDQNLDDRVECICRRDLGLLEAASLITSNAKLKATEFGDAMARYYVNFETMRVLLGLGRQSRMSDILSAIVQAQEYHDVRLRANEKKVFKEINRSNGIRFPIKVDIAMHAHKRSLIVQSELGAVELPTSDDFAKHRKQFMQDKNRLFSNIHRLIRCFIDCQIYLQDAVAVRNALELARSLAARVWDNSPFQMKQIPQIGAVAIRKLANGGITTIEALEAAEPHRIESLLSKNPPFGSKILTSLQAFPKLRVAVKLMGKLKPELPAYLFPPLSGLPKKSMGSGTSDARKPVERDMQSRRQPSSETLCIDEFDDHELDDQDMVNVASGLDFSHIDRYNVGLRQVTGNHGLSAWTPEKLDNGKWACNHKCKEKTALALSMIYSAQADPASSCKHFCCREGVDKKPKPPKTVIVPASSVWDRSETAKDNSKHSSAAATKQSKLSTRCTGDGTIETLDLATPSLMTDHRTNAPRDFRKLERLHKAVDKGVSAPVIPQTPSLNYRQGERPKFSILKTGKQDTPNTRQSTPYGDEWAKEMPSITDIISNESHSHHSKQEERLEEQVQSPADFPNPRVHRKEDEALYGDLSVSDPADNFDLIHHESDVFDTEQALIGLSDSIDMQPGGQPRKEVSPSVKRTGPLSETRSDKLFFSTDSPTKPLTPGKRAAGDLERKSSPCSAPDRKRHKKVGVNEQACQSPVSLDRLDETLVPTIKPGQPDWVYGFDPAFIAEYQDFVDFV
ncbi:MAG: hypothetical protein Q9217_000813 [Psora testacea]